MVSLSVVILGLTGWSSSSYGATPSMLAARDTVYQLDVRQRATRTPIVADVLMSVGADQVGYGSPFQSTGTATWIEGHLMTNYHVVGNAASILVVDDEGIRRQAHVVAGDPMSDLAIIEVQGWVPDGRGLTLATSRIREGDVVSLARLSNSEPQHAQYV